MVAAGEVSLRLRRDAATSTPSLPTHVASPLCLIYCCQSSRQWYTIPPPQWPNIAAPLTKTRVGEIAGLLGALAQGAFDPAMPALTASGLGVQSGVSTRLLSSLAGMPVLDHGALVTAPTIAALAMNRRPEAVLTMPQLAAVASAGGGGGGTVNNYYIEGLIDGGELDRLVTEADDRARRRGA